MVEAKWVRYADLGGETEILKLLDGLGGEPIHADALIVVAYEDDSAAAVGVLDAYAREGDFLRLGPVTVLEGYRRRGHGGLVMRMMIRRAVELGLNKHFVMVPVKSKGFFESLGFKSINDFDARMEREGDIGGGCLN
ncbi:MAG: GNAT family N-acetyltransferase [Defluviitaleaceae bacterium]|nr:GNAT family N-acetyltransferase [Defluviitaleaceae bacterium]MCL2835944.1 GNAT family N-acetyltransferase [Defluviitaleaceae bacterium]